MSSKRRGKRLDSIAKAVDSNAEKVDEGPKKQPLTAEEKKFIEAWKQNPMRKPFISKVVVNFAIGSSGPLLEKAKMLCEQLTGQKPVECRSKSTIRTWNIRKNEPIGVRVTLRHEKAIDFLKKVMWAKEDRIETRNFDKFGNLSLGIAEHLDLPNTRYDPKVGVIGFGLSATLERPGFVVKRRRYRPANIPSSHRLTREEAIAFIRSQFEVNVED